MSRSLQTNTRRPVIGRVHRLECPHEKRLFSLVEFLGTPHIHVGDLGSAIPKFAPPTESIHKFVEIKGQRYVSIRTALSWVKSWEPEQRRRLERIADWAYEALKEQ